MTDAQRIVLNWKAELKGAGWPEEQIRRIVSELCEAGYRQAVEDIQSKQKHKEAIISAATEGMVN